MNIVIFQYCLQCISNGSSSNSESKPSAFEKSSDHFCSMIISVFLIAATATVILLLLTTHKHIPRRISFSRVPSVLSICAGSSREFNSGERTQAIRELIDVTITITKNVTWTYALALRCDNMNVHREEEPSLVDRKIIFIALFLQLTSSDTSICEDHIDIEDLGADEALLFVKFFRWADHFNCVLKLIKQRQGADYATEWYAEKKMNCFYVICDHSLWIEIKSCV